MKIDDVTVRAEHPAAFCQGMDHAPVGNSSERPGEQDQIETAVGEAQVLSRADLKLDPALVPRRGEPRCAGDPLAVRVDPDHGARCAGDTSRQPSVPATDLQYAGAPQRGPAHQHPYLQPFGIRAQTSHVPPPRLPDQMLLRSVSTPSRGSDGSPGGASSRLLPGRRRLGLSRNECLQTDNLLVRHATGWERLEARGMDEPIERRTVYELVAERLLEHISQRRLRPGDALPTERELTQVYHVGRSSVREALRMLQSNGLIKPAGKGVFVVAEFANPLNHSLHLRPIL